ncbi:Glycosyltransferase involved in cell wall bisynthesis [Raineyella antarctica]|uniref:Glycosyltransferase involved in cell wall bisynthesis n=1 Tax=Raineyella antarctica TaxID=1577474 RepID=A0A1G6GEL2_9ACTN|nr:glycosyltransferase family 1 protein [Raineyella antarctica]SDB80185.1 Glycosyltransferase involved in cell wall bisynthesis [Raineyella antarctica]
MSVPPKAPADAVKRVAVKYGSLSHEQLVDADGDVSSRGAGPTLVRRLLRLFPRPILVGPEQRRCNGFDEMPLEFIDGASTVVINMDVLDSPLVWGVLKEHTPTPHVMNFFWRNVSEYPEQVQQASLGLAFGLFPTFANSERTAGEVRCILDRWTVPALRKEAVLGWENLGIRLEHARPHQASKIPIVLYPAVSLSKRKRPDLFLRVVSAVAARTPITLEMRLLEKDLVTERAMRISREKWTWVGPTTSRDEYWERLAYTTAFLATAADESYGMEYLEALLAGAVGVFPNLPWARALLPEGYPFFYDTEEQAEQLLYQAVTDPEGCRRQAAAAAGDIKDWIAARHSDDSFERAVARYTRDWFGA